VNSPQPYFSLHLENLAANSERKAVYARRTGNRENWPLIISAAHTAGDISDIVLRGSGRTLIG
jgi:hypothetical protein